MLCVSYVVMWSTNGIKRNTNKKKQILINQKEIFNVSLEQQTIYWLKCPLGASIKMYCLSWM